MQDVKTLTNYSAANMSSLVPSFVLVKKPLLSILGFSGQYEPVLPFKIN